MEGVSSLNASVLIIGNTTIIRFFKKYLYIYIFLKMEEAEKNTQLYKF